MLQDFNESLNEGLNEERSAISKYVIMKFGNYRIIDHLQIQSNLKSDRRYLFKGRVSSRGTKQYYE